MNYVRTPIIRSCHVPSLMKNQQRNQWNCFFSVCVCCYRFIFVGVPMFVDVPSFVRFIHSVVLVFVAIHTCNCMHRYACIYASCTHACKHRYVLYIYIIIYPMSSMLVNTNDLFAHFSWVLWLMKPSLFTSMSSKRTVVLSCAAVVPDWRSNPQTWWCTYAIW